MVALGRESHWLCCLCFARRGPHAAFLYTVHTLATVVVRLFSVLLYTVCVLLLHFSFQPSVSPSLSLYLSLPSPLLQIVPLSLLFSFLGLVQSYCCDCKLSFLQNKRKKEGKWGRSEIMVFTTWLTARPSNGASLETQHYSLSCTVLSECIV